MTHPSQNQTPSIVSKAQIWRVIGASLLGILCGVFVPQIAPFAEPMGEIFMKLVKMVTTPLVFFTFVHGISSADNYHEFKRVSLKALIVFVSTAALAALIGIGVAEAMRPGDGNFALVQKFGRTTSQAQLSLKQIVLDIVPSNPVKAFVDCHILQIIFFGLCTGLSLLLMKKEDASPLVSTFHRVALMFFKMIEFVMRLAPLGAFGYLTSVVADHGLGVVSGLGKLVACVFIACAVQYAVFGLFILIFCRLSPLHFYRKMIAPQIIALSTSSSKAALSTTMKVVEKELGVSSKSAKLLLPMASVINMDGGAIYQASCAVFFAQAFGIDLSLTQYCTVLLTCTIASIGGGGIPGGVLLFLSMVLGSIGLPIEAVVLIATIDRILDMATTALNVTGDACATLLVAHSEKAVDRNIYCAIKGRAKIESVRSKH